MMGYLDFNEVTQRIRMVPDGLAETIKNVNEHISNITKESNHVLEALRIAVKDLDCDNCLVSMDIECPYYDSGGKKRGEKANPQECSRQLMQTYINMATRITNTEIYGAIEIYGAKVEKGHYLVAYNIHGGIVWKSQIWETREDCQHDYEQYLEDEKLRKSKKENSK